MCRSDPEKPDWHTMKGSWAMNVALGDRVEGRVDRAGQTGNHGSLPVRLIFEIEGRALGISQLMHWFFADRTSEFGGSQICGLV